MKTPGGNLEVVGGDVVDARLLYDLGNTCFKSDPTGRSYPLLREGQTTKPKG